MAKISQDSTSYSVSGVVKRDARHSHNGPEVSRKAGKSHKNTKRWCRGKEGREHTVVLKPTSWSANLPLKDQTFQAVCTKCGMKSHRLPDEARAQVDPKIAKQLALAKEWCTEGHMFDRVKVTSKFDSSYSYSVRECAMCGKHTGRVTWED